MRLDGTPLGCGDRRSAAASGTSWAARTSGSGQRGGGQWSLASRPLVPLRARGPSGALERELVFVPRIAVIQGCPEGLLGGERWEI